MSIAKPAVTDPSMGDDHQIDVMIGHLLRIGVYVAATVILIGAAMYLFRHASDKVDDHLFKPLPPSLTSPTEIVETALHGDSMSMMQLGMLLLIAIPIARVLFSVLAFLVRRDLLYVIISLIVLLVLLYSLILH